MFNRKPPKTHLTDDGIFVVFRDFTLLEDKDFNELWRLLGVMVRGHYIQIEEKEQEKSQEYEEGALVDGKAPTRRGARR